MLKIVSRLRPGECRAHVSRHLSDTLKSVTEIASAADLPYHSVATLLQHMCRNGEVERRGKHHHSPRYRIKVNA